MAFGQEQNTGKINEPGVYRDPESGKELEVSMEAAADALVRLGWVRQETPVVEEEAKKADKKSVK